MSEEQTAIQRFEAQAKRTLEKTREDIQRLLDKMRNSKLGLEESEEEAE